MDPAEHKQPSLSEQERSRLLLESVVDYAIYMLDTEGMVSSWNSGAQRIKGYEASEILSHHFSQFYTEEDQEAGEPLRALEAAVREGRYEREGWRVRKDGTRFWAHVIIHAIRDEAGVLVGFAKVTRDLTERREAQLALEQAREQLVQSQKMESLGQLTGGLAHDFNNLLMAILASLEVVRKNLHDDPKIMRFLDNAITGAERGAALTKRMLAFARRQTLNPKPVDVAMLVHGMSGLLQRSLGPSISILTSFPLGIDHVLADANQLELALLNLAINARDAMPTGGTITIAARPEKIEVAHPTQLPPGGYVCLSITDTGEGMDEATLAKAVEPFFTTKGPGKGTGLGLSAVHGVLEQLGGRLVLKSRKGDGTTAELWLPIAASPSDEFSQPPEESGPSPGSTPSLVVLAVDDDPLVLMNTIEMLHELGHTVFEAHSGDRALEIFHQEKLIDLVITDQGMPRMTGAQLAQAIRTDNPKLPILVATGYAELPADAGIELPVLSKPFRQPELAQAIADVLAGKDVSTSH